jgi:phospholipid/cholesterol/gamma-HCH transport system substrate-binding protein
MKKPESHRTETMVGIFVLLGLSIISLLVFTIAGRQKLFEPRYRVTALFSSVAGLKVGSPVRLAGLEVGRVETLEFTAKGKVLAILSLQTRYQKQIRFDSVATISSVGVLGDKSVEISVGSQDEEIIADRGGIETKDPFDIAGFVDQTAPMAAKVDEILTYLSKITGEFSMEELHLVETIEHANRIIKKMDEGKVETA